MKLQDGKEYVDGTGEKVIVKLNYPGTKYPFERTTENNPLRHMDDGRYLDSVNEPVNIFDLKEINEEKRSYRNNGKENVPLQENFVQVCVWPSTSLGDNKVEEFIKFISDEFSGTRIQFLEEIYTMPGGPSKEETGNRCDLFFAVHKEDVGKFAIPRLKAGIRWIEDVLDPTNYRCVIYPHRVSKYKSW